MVSSKPQIHDSWYQVLSSEFQRDYFSRLKDFLLEEKKKHQVYPPGKEIFAAFNHTPFSEVKAVIIGQDPYHGPGQANGLSFSVAPGLALPPSLKNIFKELKNDLDIDPPQNGDLSKWAREGVLMLNAFLTVRHKQPASHRQAGWENFTDRVIQKISDEKQGVVFLLWGSFARSKKQFINTQKHHVLEAPHPSPFSAHSGFFGCRHFSETNRLLEMEGKTPIDWNI